MQADLDDIDAWRARVLSTISLILVILGFLAVVPSVFISIRAELWSVAIVDSLAYVWVIAIWRMPSMSYEARAWNFCALFYLLGTFLLFKVGHASQIYLMAFPVLAALLLGLQPALIALAANAITLLVGGYLLDADIHIAGLEQSPFLNWAVITVNFVIVNSLMTFTTVMLLNGLEKLLKRNRESERRYRMLTEWSPEPMGVHRNGKIVYANQATVRMLGAKSAQELMGKSILEFVHPDYRQIVLERMKAAAEHGASAPMIEERIVRLDGSIIDAEVLGIPIVYDDEPAVQLAMRDITERKRTQSERDELERKLLQAQKMEAIGNLTGGIAHDFNNLLAVILGRLEMTREELQDRPRLQEWIDACIRAADRGATLTRSMLAFSRLQPLQMVRIDVAAALRETVGLLQRTLGDSIEIKEVYPDDLWACEADPAQLQTALLNLALNARDSMPEGGKLTIEAHNIRFDADYAAHNAEVLPGDYVAVSVSDTGAGMPADVIERAFEPFFTTKDVGKGSGLGLSMVYGYLKQSGGHVKIYSEVGQGTTVNLYFPRLAPAGAANDATQDGAAGRTQGGREQILVVEDTDDMRELTVAQLQRLGYTVFSADQGADAVELLERHRDVTLLLTDVSLPGGINGRQLAERAQRMRPNLKVLYMSGYTEEALIHQGRLDPGIRLLQKPFHNDDLATQVRAALAES
jgi:PAS domain S-box-containing protein